MAKFPSYTSSIDYFANVLANTNSEDFTAKLQWFAGALSVRHGKITEEIEHDIIERAKSISAQMA